MEKQTFPRKFNFFSFFLNLISTKPPVDDAFYRVYDVILEVMYNVFSMPEQSFFFQFHFF